MEYSDASDSDEDYGENEKILEKYRNKQQNTEDSDSDDQVLGVDSDSSESSNDNIPDRRAWGKDGRKFYSTDYVDPDFGGFQGQDAHLAEQEEEEARNLQQQLIAQLDDDDFTLDTNRTEEKEDSNFQEIIQSDFSKLSLRQLGEILRKESPEFMGLIEDFQEKLEIVRDFLDPFLEKFKMGQIENNLVVEFVTSYKELILNYCVNIYMYLLLKASRAAVQNHPVIKRLYQYRQLILQLSPIYENSIKLQISTERKEENDEKLDDVQEKVKKSTKEKVKKPTTKQVTFDDQVIEEPESSSKRPITYQIAKNKGLTPHRKKELRNPRVKHRLKFKKAKISRKGAVREHRHEMSKYSGEISGIKAFVSKSIKLKS